MFEQLGNNFANMIQRQNINNQNIPSRGLCPCTRSCLCWGTWELLGSSGKAEAIVLPSARRRGAWDKHVSSTCSLSPTLEGGVLRGWVWLLLSLCLYNMWLLAVHSRWSKADLKDKVLLLCPNQFPRIITPSVLLTLTAPSQFYLHCPLCSIWDSLPPGSPPHFRLPSRSPSRFPLLASSMSVSEMLPMSVFSSHTQILAVMSTPESSPNYHAGLGLSLHPRCINNSADHIHLDSFIHILTYLPIHFIEPCSCLRGGVGIKWRMRELRSFPQLFKPPLFSILISATTSPRLSYSQLSSDYSDHILLYFSLWLFTSQDKGQSL